MAIATTFISFSFCASSYPGGHGRQAEGWQAEGWPEGHGRQAEGWPEGPGK